MKVIIGLLIIGGIFLTRFVILETIRLDAKHQPGEVIRDPEITGKIEVGGPSEDEIRRELKSQEYSLNQRSVTCNLIFDMMDKDTPEYVEKQASCRSLEMLLDIVRSNP